MSDFQFCLGDCTMAIQPLEIAYYDSIFDPGSRRKDTCRDTSATIQARVQGGAQGAWAHPPRN